MDVMILQYVLIVLLVVGVGYLLYLLKERNVSISEDYFGIASSMLSMLESNESTPENIKSVLRLVSKVVKHIEESYKDSDNSFKEQRAVEMVEEGLKAFNFSSPIPDDSVVCLVRLAVAMLPPTNKQNSSN